MKYTVFIKEYSDCDVVDIEQPLIGLTILHLPDGKVRVAALLPDLSGQIV